MRRAELFQLKAVDFMRFASSAAGCVLTGLVAGGVALSTKLTKTA